METLVLSLYGLWFWLTRKYRAAVYTEVAQTLDSARAYLITDLYQHDRYFEFERHCRRQFRTGTRRSRKCGMGEQSGWLRPSDRHDELVGNQYHADSGHKHSHRHRY